MRAILKIKPDIVFLHTVNYGRHGTPVEHTIDTWKEWGKIIKELNNVDILIGGPRRMSTAEDNSYPEKVILLYVNEESEQIEERLEKINVTLSKGFWEHVPRNKIFTYYINRIGSFSASKFIECLKTQKDCLEYVPNIIEKKDQYINNIREKYAGQLK